MQALDFAHPAVQRWFSGAFDSPTRAQQLAWPSIAAQESTLLLAPTGSGKTLAAFLVALNRIMFGSEPDAERATRVLYISPLKALGVDVERNLRAPLAGIRAVALREGSDFVEPVVGVRSGDTSQKERAQLVRNPPDILITTPESLYLMLTSRARSTLTQVETVIVDEIHSMSSTKRGVHLFVSLERLEHQRKRWCVENDVPYAAMQRIGLSATQRPLDEIARLLGGFEPPPDSPASEDERLRPRPVRIVDAGRTKTFDIQVTVPVEDMAQLAAPSELAPPETDTKSIWPAIHPRLLELIRAHRSTMIFANSRRLAERLALAINELAEEEVALAHHGSIAKDTRAVIEDRLKRGQLPAIVATSSLELGIDMGAVDLVVQIEAPTSVASGIQRIGRAGHQVGEVSRGVMFPKFRGDLLACAAIVQHIQAGHVESSRYPRNPLDVLAQQIVAILAAEILKADVLFNLVRQAAPFADLARETFEGVLDMLSGRYPSERFRELRPRINWDRISGELSPRRGARLLAIANSGTIVDRGLYGVFLAGSEPAVRVGELDEEMVFESRPGEVFLLGASSWRIEDITHDRVLVTPAPAEPGRLPFWRGDKPGRPYEFGVAIGRLAREVAEKGEKGIAPLTQEHGLDERAATNLVSYLVEQQEDSFLPTDRTIVVESFTDEVGDWRVTVLSPFGGRVHAPWATVVAARLEQELGLEVDSMWADDGMMFRLPESDEPPELKWFLPDAETAKDGLTRALGSTALFAAHFRENAARALLLPRRRPGQRTPLWVQRRRSSDLLKVATEFADFPIVLETFRECLQDVFDLPALMSLLSDVERGKVQVKSVRTPRASPFAAALTYAYVANFLYAEDAPLAERRAQALSLDQDQLRLLLGEPELRELLDAEAITQLELQLQRLDGERPLRDADDVHDLLLWLGDLSKEEIAIRAEVDSELLNGWLGELTATSRAFEVKVPHPRGSSARWIAAEDAARFRDALGVVLPMGVPDAFIEPAQEPVLGLVLRFARCHGPFSIASLSERYGLSEAIVLQTLERLERDGEVVQGGFLPRGQGQEWCHSEVLRRLKRASLAKLRKQVEPVEPDAFARFLLDWHHLERPLFGLDGLLTAVEQLQGFELPFQDLESILAARVREGTQRDLDELCAAGEVVWRGFGSPSEPKLALYLTEHYALAAPPVAAVPGPVAEKVRAFLAERGASFFSAIAAELGGFQNDLFDTLWQMVWSGEVTNDTLAPLRSLGRDSKPERAARPGRRSAGFRSRRAVKPGSEGRWTLLPDGATTTTPAERFGEVVEQLLRRYGVITREAVRGEGIAGGFSTLYPLLKAMEESGKLRRGYFIAGFGATQFAAPGSEGRLRSFRRVERPADAEDEGWCFLAATDPANPYGLCLPWPDKEGARVARAAGSSVLLKDGQLLCYLNKGRRGLVDYAAAGQHEAIADVLVKQFNEQGERAWLVTTIDAGAAAEHPLGEAMVKAGFVAGPKGLLLRRAPADIASRRRVQTAR